MKKAFLALALFALLVAPKVVAAEPLPIHQCTEAPCTSEQQRIWNQFEAGGSLDHSVVGRVYSGSCYHRSSNMDPNHEHYGVVFLDSVGTDVFMNGQFGFFFNANPYASWTPQDAMKELSPAHKPYERVMTENGYVCMLIGKAYPI